MRRLILLSSLMIAIAVNTASAQVQYSLVLSAADSLRANGDVEGAIGEYRKTYEQHPDDRINLYNYACAFSIVGQFDSSLKYVNKYMQRDTQEYMMVDPDFNHLRADNRWEAIEDKMVAMLEHKDGKKLADPAYTKKLWRMHALDQAYYSEIKLAQLKTTMNSSLVRAIWDMKAMLNEQNQADLEALIKTKGWPKYSTVGKLAAGSAFLVIQHADTDKQRKYLPTIKQLSEAGEASRESYALMYDRVQMADKKPQRYGSQVTYNAALHKYELYTIEDETKVDEWRKEAGMGPLKDYASRWGITYEPKKKK